MRGRQPQVSRIDHYASGRMTLLPPATWRPTRLFVLAVVMAAAGLIVFALALAVR